MFGRSDDEEKIADQNADWASRLDRLMAGNLNEQVGSVLQAIAQDVATMAARVQSLEKAIADGSSAVSVEESLSAIWRHLESLPTHDAIVQAVREAAPDPSSRIESVETALASAVESLRSDVRAAIASMPAPAAGLSADDVKAIVEQRFKETDERIENLGRQIGGALGRVRVQSEELAGKAEALGALREDIAASADRMAASVSEQSSASVDQIATSVQQVVTSVERELVNFAGKIDGSVRQSTESMDEKLAASATAIAASVAENLSAVREEVARASGQIAASVAESVARLDAQIAALPNAGVIASEMQKSQEVNDKRMEVLAQQVASISARAKAALETLGAQVDTITQRVEAGVAAGLSDLQGRLAALDASISEKLDERVQSLRESMSKLPTRDSIEESLRGEREASERRSQGVAQQLAAVVGSAISSLDELRAQVGILASKPDVSAELKTEIESLLSVSAGRFDERLNAIEQAIREMPAGDAMLSAVAPALNEASNKMKAHIDERMGAIRAGLGESMADVNAQVAAMSETVDARLAELTENLAGLPGEERFATLMREMREFEEQMARDRTEQFSTLSASVGAIYLRVRSLEQAIASFKQAAEGTAKEQSSKLLERVNEVSETEQRLMGEMASIEDMVRERTVERERDREIMSILAELAETAQKQGRGGLADRLRSLITRSGSAGPELTVDLDADDKKTAATATDETT